LPIAKVSVARMEAELAAMEEERSGSDPLSSAEREADSHRRAALIARPTLQGTGSNR
jgi:hypothetical protein